MATQLSPESEAFLAELVARQEFSDRAAVLEEAVTLLRKRRATLDAIAVGEQQLREGCVHHYEPHELDRFLADVEERQRQRHPQ